MTHRVMPPSMPCHEYRIAPELRRCCWYTIVGSLALVVVFYWVARFAQNRGPADIVFGCSLFALLAAAMVVPLRWKVRVDEHGISRRSLLRWDVWPWAALASGRVTKLHPFTLYDPQRPWGRRKLRLGSIDPGEIQEVLSMVNRHYRLPPPPNISTPLTIKYGFRRSATFDLNGIHLFVDGMPREYLWRDVRDIHITRMDPLRRDFTSLVMTLPDQELEFKLVSHQGGTSPTWRGATAEELNEVLVQFAPADRIHVSIAGQPLVKREHIQRKLAAAKKRARDLMILTAVYHSLFLSLLAWMAVDDGILKATVVGAMCALYPGSVLVFMYRSQYKEIAELRTLLNDASGQSAAKPVSSGAR